MGDPVYGNGKKSRIAENNFVMAFGGGIPFINSPDICCQYLSQRWNRCQKVESNFLALLLAVAARLAVPEAFMPDAVGNLFGNHIKKNCNGLADVVFQIDRIDLAPGKIARKENFS